MWHFLLTYTDWITVGEISLVVTVFLMVKSALYRYVLRRLEMTRETVELLHQIYDDPTPLRGVYVPLEEVIARCRLLWGLSSTPNWLAHLALQWEEHKKKGRI